MSFIVHLEELANQSHQLSGRVSMQAMDSELHDELIHLVAPLEYDFTVRLEGDTLVAEGRLKTTAHCECSRCLKPFRQSVLLDSWRLDLPLKGEDAPPLEGDALDLTPWVREDIFLALPQHPLCVSGCPGLQNPVPSQPEIATTAEAAPSIWAALDERKTH